MGQAARRVGGGRRIPVVMLTGFLGAGKTTALNGLLANPPRSGARVAVVVNEFGELGVDAGLVGPGPVHTWEINKGSLFCTCTREYLRRVLAEIAGGRLSSRPPRGASEPRTAFVAILEGLDPLEAQAALRDCERRHPATRIPVRSAPDG